MDWLQMVKWVVIAIALYLLYSIAMTKGIWGLAFVFVIVVIGIFVYLRQEEKKKLINPVTEYYKKLLLLCKLNRNPSLKFLRMSGDHYNQSFVKGMITGGALARKGKTFLFTTDTVPIEQDMVQADGSVIKTPAVNEAGQPVYKTVRKPNTFIDEDTKQELLDPRADSYVFSYTSDYGGIYEIPIIGNLWASMFRKEYLILIYKHQLDTQYMYGDVIVKGINTRFVGLMEYVVDWTLDEDAEMKLLSLEIDRETLLDQFGRLPYLVRQATDSNPHHLRNIDMGNDTVR
jgi:uncharacterized membrane protein